MPIIQSSASSETEGRSGLAELTIDQMIAALEQLSEDELVFFTRRAILLHTRRGIPLLIDEEEQALLNAIYGRLPPTDQDRLDGLREKSRYHTLTPAEHAELLTFVQRVERNDVAKAEALVHLAKKRGVNDALHLLNGE